MVFLQNYVALFFLFRICFYSNIVEKTIKYHDINFVNKIQYCSVFFKMKKIKSFWQLTKPRLSSLVIFSGAVGYLVALPSPFSWADFCIFIVASYGVTGGAGSANQIIERKSDSLMPRTQKRPLVVSAITVSQAIIFTCLLSLAGFVLMAYLSWPAFYLSALSYVSYVAVYTLLKSKTTFSVFIGAIPGALPVLIGFIVVSSELSNAIILLFILQFIWQFPHFWSIAWVVHEQYNYAGFQLLPSQEGQDIISKLFMLIYSLFLFLVSILPYFFGIFTVFSTLIITLVTSTIVYFAAQLFLHENKKNAKKLLRWSLVYLPVIQLAFIWELYT